MWREKAHCLHHRLKLERLTARSKFHRLFCNSAPAAFATTQVSAEEFSTKYKISPDFGRICTWESIGIIKYRTNDGFRLRGVINAQEGDIVVKEIDTKGRVAELTEELTGAVVENFPKLRGAGDYSSVFWEAFNSKKPGKTLEAELGLEKYRHFQDFLLGDDYAHLVCECNDSFTATIMRGYICRVGLSAKIRTSVVRKGEMKQVWAKRSTSKLKALNRVIPDWDDCDDIMLFWNAGPSENTMRIQMDKNHRKAITTIEAIFPSFAVSPDFSGETTALEIRWKNSSASYELREQTALRFVLTKSNLSQLKAVKALERGLNLPPNSVRYGSQQNGIGTTSQFVTLRGVTPKSLLLFNKFGAQKLPPNTNIQIGNVQKAEEDSKIGSTRGSEITVKIRGIEGITDPERLQNIFRDRGYVNYFGPQRFDLDFDGSTLIQKGFCKYKLGLAFLRADWEQAILWLCAPKNTDRDDAIQKARYYLVNSKDPEGALKLLRPDYEDSNFYRMLCCLNAHGWRSTGFKRAIRTWPRMYISSFPAAYQSLVWNCTASHRVGMNPDQVILGDMVCTNPEITEENIEVLHTEERCSRFAMSDVVIPTVGVDFVQYRKKSNVYQFVTQFLQDDGLRFQSFDLKDIGYPLDYKVRFRRLIDFPESIRLENQGDDLSMDFSLKKTAYLSSFLRELGDFLII